MLSLSDFVETELLKLGATPDYVGYRYLVTAILKCIRDESLLYAITTRLYKEIAEEYSTTPINVERGMRTLISILWLERDHDKFAQLMGRRYETPPGNGKLIGVLSRRLLFKYRTLTDREPLKPSGLGL
ncbi:MAG: sporulation initiation factor Spo0A C-terminal domain-containing protein [Clostridiaceae bacterium]|nr:sporulation initiation factor Spo0A C-terminal domain-containing protein [Eubacteriales bacterium]